MLWATEELLTVWQGQEWDWKQRTGWGCYDTSGGITAAAGSRGRGRGSFPLHLQFCVSISSQEALLVCHSHTARATRAAVTSSQKTQTETQPDRDKNWIPGHANVQAHCWKQLCSFRSVRAATDVFVSVLSLWTRAVIPREPGDGVDGMAVLYFLSEWHWSNLIS